MTATLKIGNRQIGSVFPPFSVAEIGVNHRGSAQTATALVDRLLTTNIDCIKFQLFRGTTLGRTLKEKRLLRRLELPLDVLGRLKEQIEEAGKVFLCTPFAEQDVLDLKALGVQAVKISSRHTTDFDFLNYVHKMLPDVPMIISTGMHTMRNVFNTLYWCGETHQVIGLLHCISEYPPKLEDLNLACIQYWGAPLANWAHQVVAGFSDHTPYPEIAMLAVANGACIVEKHVRFLECTSPDVKASMLIDQVDEMVAGMKRAFITRGDGLKAVTKGERQLKRELRVL